MFIAHLPSGYIFSSILVERIRKLPVSASKVIWTGIIGALAPDFDLAYFFLVDHRQTHHHWYFTHWPLFWLTLLLVSVLGFAASRRSKFGFLSIVFFTGCMIHVFLDSFVGDIWWLAPFFDRPFSMFTVPHNVDPWWLNFILHWSFAVELAICSWALLIYRRRKSVRTENARDDLGLSTEFD